MTMIDIIDSVDGKKMKLEMDQTTSCPTNIFFCLCEDVLIKSEPN